MISGVIADFKTILMQLGNLFPCHVVAFIVFEVEALGDEEGCGKSVCQQHRSYDSEVRLGRVVKGQHDQFLRNGLARLQYLCRP